MFARLAAHLAQRRAYAARFRPRRGRMGEVIFVTLLGIGTAHYIMAPIIWQANHDGVMPGAGGGDGDGGSAGGGDGGGGGGSGSGSAPAAAPATDGSK